MEWGDASWDVDTTADGLNKTLFGKKTKKNVNKIEADLSVNDGKISGPAFGVDSDDEDIFSKKGKKKLKEKKRKENKRNKILTKQKNQEDDVEITEKKGNEVTVKDLNKKSKQAKPVSENPKGKKKGEKPAQKPANVSKNSAVKEKTVSVSEADKEKSKEKKKKKNSQGGEKDQEMSVSAKTELGKSDSKTEDLSKKRKRKRKNSQGGESDQNLTKTEVRKSDSEAEDVPKKKRKKKRKPNSKRNKYLHLALKSKPGVGLIEESNSGVNQKENISLIKKSPAVSITPVTTEVPKGNSRKRKNSEVMENLPPAKKTQLMDQDGKKSQIIDQNFKKNVSKKSNKEKDNNNMLGQNSVENQNNDNSSQFEEIKKKKKINGKKMEAKQQNGKVQGQSLGGQQSDDNNKLIIVQKSKRQEKRERKQKLKQENHQKPELNSVEKKGIGANQLANGLQATSENMNKKNKNKAKQIINGERNPASSANSNQLPFNATASLNSNRSPFSSSKAIETKEKLTGKLSAARFRFINEQLYNMRGGEALRMFEQDRSLIEAYHAGFQGQVKHWPVNPLDIIIKQVSAKPSNLTIADFGCGEARLSSSVPQKVHSFDLYSINERVTVCDMSKTPLPSGSVDIAVFCLSLMGTNVNDYILEANRVLRDGGILKIAEVSSRLTDPNDFISAVSSMGFKAINTRELSSMFYLLDFKKFKNVEKKSKAVKIITLNPCKYKKR